ncbi:hypothetical protein V6N11_076859 [Hibiscus sabdariffa]|uniref:Uncharacterized protein n=1 Tax=Hibiscus sabdariffa TaxID=183260 RepID=A0ABR2TBQ1_9ROSI
MWNGTTSSERVGGGVGAEPKGESGVDCLLFGVAGVVVGVEAVLVTGVACGVATGLDFSMVYLFAGQAGTAALRQTVEMMQRKARIPLSFWQAVDSSLAMSSPTLNLYPVIIAFLSTSRVRSMV